MKVASRLIGRFDGRLVMSGDFFPLFLVLLFLKESNAAFSFYSLAQQWGSKKERKNAPDIQSDPSQ